MTRETVPDDTKTPLRVAGSGQARPRLLPRLCALCSVPPASPLGLCLGHLRQAADELVRLVPPPRAGSDPLPCSVPFTDLCTRCGRPGHDQQECDA